MTTVAEESFSNVRTVKAFSNEVEETAKFDKGNDSVFVLGRKKAIYQGFFSFGVQVFLYGGMSGIIYLSSVLYQRG